MNWSNSIAAFSLISVTFFMVWLIVWAAEEVEDRFGSGWGMSFRVLIFALVASLIVGSFPG